MNGARAIFLRGAVEVLAWPTGGAGAALCNCAEIFTSMGRHRASIVASGGRAGRGQAAALKPRLPPLIRGFQLCVESATSGAQPSGRALISPFVWLRRRAAWLE